ncbi:hypothetical protein PTKIN_Ptkin11bG0150500 [Pterospermum kingtungense]
MPSCFQPDILVALLLPSSCIEQLWKDNRPLNKLKILNLEGSQNLIKTPDFEIIPNIESLNFEACTKLEDLHPSIAFLRSLKLLNLRNCKRLRRLPTKIGMGCLQKLILRGCSNLKRFPETDGEMKCLVELYLNGTGIEELLSSVGHLNSLVLLNLKDCKNLASLPCSIFHNKKSTYGIIIPENEIPEWYSTRDESSINIALASNIRNDSERLGVGLCFVFVSVFNDDSDACEEEAIEYKAVIHRSRSVGLQCTKDLESLDLEEEEKEVEEEAGSQPKRLQQFLKLVTGKKH